MYKIVKYGHSRVKYFYISFVIGQCPTLTRLIVNIPYLYVYKDKSDLTLCICFYGNRRKTFLFVCIYYKSNIELKQNEPKKKKKIIKLNTTKLVSDSKKKLYNKII